MTDGTIHNIDLYLESKIYDNSDWDLPRGCKPSDMDQIYDNNGRMLFVDWKSYHVNFAGGEDNGGLKTGQRRLHFNLVEMGKGEVFSVIAIYNHTGKPINSMKDCKEFQVLFYNKDTQEVQWTEFHDGKYWSTFVRRYIYLEKR